MALKGNKNALGNKGGRRKSAYQELADARTLQEMYFKTHSQEEIEAAIRAGNFSIKQRHILNALEGDQKAINVIFSKLFPDTMEMSGKDGEPLNVVINVPRPPNE